MPAAGALQQRCPHRPRFVVPASRTTKTLRPAELTQILSTGLLGGETRLELGQIPRIIFHFPDPTSCGHLSQVNTHLLQKGHLTGLDEDTAKTIILLRSAERNQLGLTRLLDAFPFRYSATANTFGEVFIRRWERQRAALERSMIIRNAEMPFDIVSPPHMKGFSPAEFAVEVWKTSSRMTHQVCRQRGIPYLHALQPNQYVPGSKPLSKAEMRTAVDPEFGWGITVRENYHLLRQAGKELASSGVPFVDLTQVFSETREDLYVDKCCHFSERGNALIAEPIAAALAEIID